MPCPGCRAQYNERNDEKDEIRLWKEKGKGKKRREKNNLYINAPRNPFLMPKEIQEEKRGKGRKIVQAFALVKLGEAKGCRKLG